MASICLPFKPNQNTVPLKTDTTPHYPEGNWLQQALLKDGYTAASFELAPLLEGGSSVHVVRRSSVHVVKRSFVHVFFVQNSWYLQQIGLVIRARADQKRKKSCFAWVLPCIRSRKFVRVGLKSRRSAVRSLSSQHRMIPAVIQLDESNDLDSLFGHRMIPQVKQIIFLD